MAAARPRPRPLPPARLAPPRARTAPRAIGRRRLLPTAPRRAAAPPSVALQISSRAIRVQAHTTLREVTPTLLRRYTGTLTSNLWTFLWFLPSSSIKCSNIPEDCSRRVARCQSPSQNVTANRSRRAHDWVIRRQSGLLRCIGSGDALAAETKQPRVTVAKSVNRHLGAAGAGGGAMSRSRWPRGWRCSQQRRRGGGEYRAGR